MGLDWLKNAIFENDGTDPKKEEKKVDANQPIKTQMSNSENNSTPAVKTYSAPENYSSQKISPDAIQHFYTLIKESNLPGPDFYEFHETLKVMSAISDEAIKYRAVMAGLAAQNATKEIIVTSANQYITLVKNSIADFEKEFQKTVKQQIGDKRNLIEIKKKDVEKLTAQLQTLNEEINTLSFDADKAEKVLSEKKDLFLNAGNVVVVEIEDELKKINTYL